MSNKPWQYIPSQLDKVRKMRGLSNAKLGKLVGEKASNVSRTLHAKSSPMNISRMVAYMEALRVDWNMTPIIETDPTTDE